MFFLDRGLQPEGGSSMIMFLAVDLASRYIQTFWILEQQSEKPICLTASISQGRVKTFLFVPSPGSNLSRTPMCSQSTDFAHICWIVLRTRCSRRIKGFPVCPRFVLPSALHPQPRCFCWNSPSLKAPHTAFGAPSMRFFFFCMFSQGRSLVQLYFAHTQDLQFVRHFYSWLCTFSI